MTVQRQKCGRTGFGTALNGNSVLPGSDRIGVWEHGASGCARDFGTRDFMDMRSMGRMGIMGSMHWTVVNGRRALWKAYF